MNNKNLFTLLLATARPGAFASSTIDANIDRRLMRIRFNCRTLLALSALGLLAVPLTSQAQWLTQSIGLKAGWNAVFLHVDASHDTLNALVAADISNPIQEVWRWNAPSVAQFTDSPAQPTATVEWISWNRTNASSALQRLVGDSAYLVRVGSNVATYNWNIKGRPVAPRHDWTISGLNLIGFSTVPNSPPNFRAFLAQATEFQSATPEIYHYPGGDLSTNNPVLVASPFLQQLLPVKRGQAFWVRSGTVFNPYFGPFEVVLSGTGGVDFGETSSSSIFRLRNLTTSNLTVSLRLADSEAAPVGQPNIVALPPLLLRGSLNLTNLTYGYANLPANTARTWTLAPRDLPGSDVEVVLGLNRAAITSESGSLLAGVLRFTDSLGFSQVDVPVAVTVASGAGLWVGEATVTNVNQYLKTFARGAVTNYLPAATGTNYIAPSAANSTLTVDTNGLLTSSKGSYIIASVDTSPGGVPQAFPLRLIVHNPTNGSAVLLQRVYFGLDGATNSVVATSESALHPGFLKQARRITSTQLPWSSNNTTWALGGRLRQQTNFTAAVTLAYNDQASNPFLHTYHPDHDNLKPDFKQEQPQGSESYAVERAITILVKAPNSDFSSLVAAADSLSGDYLETITFKGLARPGNTFDTRQYQVSGVFTLNRINQVPTLTLAP